MHSPTPCSRSYHLQRLTRATWAQAGIYGRKPPKFAPVTRRFRVQLPP